MSTLAGAVVNEPARRSPGRPPMREREDVVLASRIQAEFLEMPGLHLTPQQAARVFGIEAGHAVGLMNSLVDRGVLICDSEGVYRRAGTGERGVQRPCIVCRR